MNYLVIDIMTGFPRISDVRFEYIERGTTKIGTIIRAAKQTWGKYYNNGNRLSAKQPDCNLNERHLKTCCLGMERIRDYANTQHS